VVHSGWRGAAAEIAAAAVERLARLGHDPRTLSAAVSPCLHACCFEVGPEVVALFAGEHLPPHRSGKHALDLPGAIAATLRRAGLPAESIHLAEECTSCSAGRYYSHRRDHGVTGRHWGLLALAGR
jgi:copper oxidase (laccase) domain-containing protein